MFQVRIHGRGGQGVVTASELLSVAAFDEGRHAQAFPTFGSERTGAPVVSSCRIDEKEIRTREPVSQPDAVIIQDPTLLHQVDLFGGLEKDGYILLNSERDFEELGMGEFIADFRPERVRTMPATRIAREYLGRPMPNSVLLGGFAGLCDVVNLDAVTQALRDRFPGKLGDLNTAAATAAWEFVATVQSGSVHA